MKSRTILIAIVVILFTVNAAYQTFEIHNLRREVISLQSDIDDIQVSVGDISDINDNVESVQQKAEEIEDETSYIKRWMKRDY